MKDIEINLNKLYSPNKPDLTNIGEYYEKIKIQLSGLNLKDVDILLTGTAPIWLTVKIVLFLEPYVNSISLLDKINNRTIPISSVSNKFFNIK